MINDSLFPRTLSILNTLPNESSDEIEVTQDSERFFINLLKNNSLPIPYLFKIQNLLNTYLLKIYNLVCDNKSQQHKLHLQLGLDIYNFFHSLYEDASKVDQELHYQKLISQWDLCCKESDIFFDNETHSILKHLHTLPADFLTETYDDYFSKKISPDSWAETVLCPSFLNSFLQLAADFPVLLEPCKNIGASIYKTFDEIFILSPDEEAYSLIKQKLNNLDSLIFNHQFKLIKKGLIIEENIKILNQTHLVDFQENLLDYYQTTLEALSNILNQNFEELAHTLVSMEQMIDEIKKKFPFVKLMRQIRSDSDVVNIFTNLYKKLYSLLDSRLVKFRESIYLRINSFEAPRYYLSSTKEYLKNYQLLSTMLQKAICNCYYHSSNKEIKKIDLAFILIFKKLENLNPHLKSISVPNKIIEDLEDDFVEFFLNLYENKYTRDMTAKLIFHKKIYPVFDSSNKKIFNELSNNSNFHDLKEFCEIIKKILDLRFTSIFKQPMGDSNFNLKKNKHYTIDFIKVFVSIIQRKLSKTENTYQFFKENIYIFEENYEALNYLAPFFLLYENLLNFKKNTSNIFDVQKIIFKIKDFKQKFDNEYFLNNDFFSYLARSNVDMNLKNYLENLLDFKRDLERYLLCFETNTNLFINVYNLHKKNNKITIHTQTQFEFHKAKPIKPIPFKGLSFGHLAFNVPLEKSKNPSESFIRNNQMTSSLRNCEFYILMFREFTLLQNHSNLVRTPLFFYPLFSSLYLEQIEKFSLAKLDIYENGEHVLLNKNNQMELRSSHHINELYKKLGKYAPELTTEQENVICIMDTFLPKSGGRIILSSKNLIFSHILNYNDTLAKKSLVAILNYSQELLNIGASLIQSNQSREKITLTPPSQQSISSLKDSDKKNSFILTLFHWASKFSSYKCKPLSNEILNKYENRVEIMNVLNKNFSRNLKILKELHEIDTQQKIQIPLFYAISFRTCAYTLLELTLLMAEAILPLSSKIPSQNAVHSLYDEGHLLNFSYDTKYNHNYSYFIELIEGNSSFKLSDELKNRILALQNIIKNENRYPAGLSFSVGTWWALLAERSNWCISIETNEVTEKISRAIKEHTFMEPGDALYSLREEIEETLEKCTQEAVDALKSIGEIISLIDNWHV